MPDYYADSSILVKRHVQEKGTAWFQSLVAPNTGNIMLTARISLVEVCSALNRRLREAHLTLADYVDIMDDFEFVCATEYQMVELTPTVVNKARLLLEHHPLRAYDAVQLASALLASETLQATGLPSLIFLAADDRLISAAQAEGLITDNPNDHPE